MTKLQSLCPSSFKKYKFTHSLSIDKESQISLWKKLNRRETFTEGQIFPYKVEFESGESSGFFEQGELNIHHGPFLSVHGAIGKISDTYRSLDYFYGSYVLSFRLVRPTKLEFFQTSEGMRMELTAFVAPWFLPFWNLGNKAFWKVFEFLFKA